MKMHFWSLFWGCFFILLGLSMVLKAAGINFPFFKFAFGFFIILIGVSIIVPGFFSKCCGTFSSDRTVMFGEGRVGGNSVSGEYSTVFGHQVIDLTTAEPKAGGNVIRIDAVFSGVEVVVDPTKPLKIKASSAFGGVNLPNGNAAAFGETSYESPAFKAGEPSIVAEITAVFGGVDVRLKQ